MKRKCCELLRAPSGIIISICVPLALAAVPCYGQSVFGHNLVVNGDAEAGPAVSSVLTTVANIPSWTRTGNLNVVSYNTPTSLQTSTDPAPVDHGFQYFASSSGLSSMTQNIDVSSAASAISAGTVKYTASASLGLVYGTSPSMVVAFENAKGQSITTVTLTQGITGGGRNAGPVNIAYLYQQSTIGLVPSGTVTINVTLNFYGAPASYYATADSLAVQLDMLGTSPSSVLGNNLITNGNAEMGPNATWPAPVLYIPGWSSDTVSVSPYGGSGWIQASSPGPADRATSLFTGFGTMRQYLDVSPAASLIDGGTVTFAISGWLGGISGSLIPSITYEFHDWSGKILVPTAQVGPSAHNGTSLVFASASGLVPAGTRVVLISLSMRNVANIPDLADDISFILNPVGAPQITSGGIVPVFSNVSTIEPGAWASIYGMNLASGTTIWKGDFPQLLGTVSVTVNSKPAYLWYVSPTQINFQAPDDTATGPVNVTVTNSNGSVSAMVNLAQYAPSFSLYDSTHVAAIVPTVGQPGNSGSGYDYIGPANGLPFAARPAKVGETVAIYGVGFGATNPRVSAGAALTSAAASVVLPTITIGGVSAKVAYGGEIEAGLFQFNVVVPSAGSGDQKLVAMIGGVTTPSNVVITLQ